MSTPANKLAYGVKRLQTTSIIRQTLWALLIMGVAAALGLGIAGIVLPKSGGGGGGGGISSINGVPGSGTGNIVLTGMDGISINSGPGPNQITVDNTMTVALVEPVEFIVSGSPIDGNGGTFTVTKANQAANQAWLGPPSGAPAPPTFRALVSTDIPSALSITSLAVSGSTFLGTNTTCVTPLLPSCYDISNQQCLGGPLAGNCLPSNAVFDNLVVNTLTVVNGTANNGTSFNNTILGTTFLTGPLSCSGNGSISNGCLNLGGYTCPMGMPLAESCIPASLVMYDLAVTNNLTVNQVTCAGGPIPTSCISPDLVVLDAAATPTKYPDGTNTKGVWYGLNTKANAFDSTCVTIGDNADTNAANGVAVGNGAVSAFASGTALGASATLVDVAHGLGFGVPTASVLPGSFGLSVNSAPYQLSLYTSLYATTMTTGGTTTLTVTSAQKQRFSGTLSQTVVLPVVTTLSNGFQFYIINDGTGTVTVQTSGLATLASLGSTAGGTATVVDTAGGTGTPSWHFGFDSTGTIVLDPFATPTFPAPGDTKGIWYGTNTKANAYDSTTITIGNNADTNGAGNIALGSSAVSSGQNCIAIGSSASTPSGYNSIAIGTGAVCASPFSGPSDGQIAIGTNANVGFGNSIAIGVGASAAHANSGDVAVGPFVAAENARGMSFGISITNNGVQSLALGYVASNPSGITYNNIAIGTGATTGYGGSTIAFGTGATTANGDNAVAIGASAIADATSSTAVGAFASSNGISQSVTLNGAGAVRNPVDTAHAFAIGINTASVLPGSFGLSVNNAIYQLPLYTSLFTTTATAGGTTTLTVTSAQDQRFSGTLTQTVVLPDVTTLSNGFQFTFLNDATGTITIQTSGLVTLATLTATQGGRATVVNTAGGTGTPSWHFGYDSSGNPVLDSSASPTYPTTNANGVWYGIGTAASATNIQNTAIGNNAVAGARGTAIGYGANANSQLSFAGGAGASATGTYAVAVGPASTSADFAVAISTASASQQGVSIGGGAQTLGFSGVAVGYGSFAQGNSVAIGPVASSSTGQSTAVGFGSVVNVNYGTAIGNQASTNGVDGSIVLSSSVSGAVASDVSHAFGLSINGASVLPGSFGLTVNAAPYQLPLYTSLYASTATAAATTTLTATSAKMQRFSGSTTQTCVLPVVTTLSNGFEFVIFNDSTGAVTVQSSGGNTVTTLAAANVGVSRGGWGRFVCVDTAGGTTAASWSYLSGATTL